MKTCVPTSGLLWTHHSSHFALLQFVPISSFFCLVPHILLLVAFNPIHFIILLSSYFIILQSFNSPLLTLLLLPLEPINTFYYILIVIICIGLMFALQFVFTFPPLVCYIILNQTMCLNLFTCNIDFSIFNNVPCTKKTIFYQIKYLVQLISKRSLFFHQNKYIKHYNVTSIFNIRHCSFVTIRKKVSKCLTLEYRFSDVSKPQSKCQSTIGWKIPFVVLSLKASIDRTLKWCRRRGVIALPPPAGGAMASTRDVFLILIMLVSFLSKAI